MNNEVKLPKEVAEKYELVEYGPGSPKQRWGKYGVIDVREITLDKADRLHRAGWPKLQLKEQPKGGSGSGPSLPTKK